MTAAIEALNGHDSATRAAKAAGYYVARSTAPSKRHAAKRTAVKAERTAQCALLRDIMGNPFQPVTPNPAWPAWNDRTILRLTEGIYADRAFDRLPILADALEEAGCTDEAILSHCRGPGPHVRGCWVVDLVLGKE
jgi:hypothetical protein